jgi:hypothetical protein
MPTRKTRLAALGCALALLGLPTTAGAAVTSLTVNKCLAGKVKAVGKSVSLRATCASKDAASGVPNLACTQKASDKFTGDGTPANGAFNKLDARYPLASTTPCLTFNDQGTFESDIAGYAATIPGTTGSATGKCDAAKIRCVGTYVKAIMSCRTKAAKVTGTIDPSCVAKATTKLTGTPGSCLERAAGRGDCTHAGTQATALQAGADAFIKEATCTLDPANPGCGCPTSYTFTANGADADIDIGWTGINHDRDMPSMSQLSFAISGCPNTKSPCGTCTLSGPTPNLGGAAVDNHRCRGTATGANGTWLSCNSDADCPGTDNACGFFFGPPRPGDVALGVLCTTTEVEAATGTIDPDAGALALTATVTTRSYNGASYDNPCPLCTGGFCNGGDRSSMPCVVQGHTASFDDDTSLDCPPVSGAVVSTQTSTVALGTGTQSVTLSAANPHCRAPGWTGMRCFCDTCNDLNADPCMTDATCPMSGGNPGICGGKRCNGGPNAGVACSATSECAGGGCSIVGVGSAPNQCDDGVCTPNTPPDNDSTNEGACLGGPFEGFCTLQPYRYCATATDCPLAGDSCAFKARECFTTNGAIGDTVSASGQTSPSAPSLAALYCIPPAAANFLNTSQGLPGLMRLTIPGVATTD